MKRILSFMLSILLISVFATGCLTGCTPDKEQNAEPEIDDTMLIGFSFDTFVVERWERDRDIFISAANELGADVNIQSANGSVDEQKSQIDYFIEKGADVIVIVPVDCGALREEVEKAHEEGIIVVSYDRLIENADVDLYITFDNYKVGTLMADSIYDEIGKDADVVLINGPTTDGNVDSLRSGFIESAEAHSFNILDEVYVDGWSQELAYNYVIENIDSISGADAVMCGNDAIAGRVIQALSEHRLAGNIIVVGQDADLEACQRIVEGTQYMTVYKPINELAENAAMYSVALCNGEEISLTGTIFDGEYYVPYVAIKPYAVTADNIDSLIIESGFHQEDDVYLFGESRR